jgi:signal transduction histidine kinase
MDGRILVLAPHGRDAVVICETLSAVGNKCLICRDLSQLTDELHQTAGAAILTEEALAAGATDALGAWLDQQPPWSDFPFIVLVTRQPGRRTQVAAARLQAIGNIVLLERPINAETLVSAADSALRGRRRQYAARQHLADKAAVEDQLRRLNENLESRVAQSTEQLREANRLLRLEITEREQAQAALLQAQKMEAIGQLTGGIAHDFNNLLTAIVGNLDMIERRADDGRVVRMAGFARQAAERATKLTAQLLAFSRSQQLDLQPVAVDAMIRGMTDLLERSLGHTVRVDMDLRAGSACAVADPTQLELAVLNLSINARDAMAEGGHAHYNPGRQRLGGRLATRQPSHNCGNRHGRRNFNRRSGQGV